MTASSQKDMLRQEALRHRKRIDPSSEDPDRLTDLFFEKIQPENNQIVATYWPLRHEFDPSSLTVRLMEEGVTCVLPVVKQDTRVLYFYEWDGKTPLKKGQFDIMQPDIKNNINPVAPDIVLVPFLAFDRKGNRIGYGGGYYDATLAALRAEKEITAVGIGYAQQAVLFNLPTEPHDQKLDWIITPQAAHDHTDQKAS